MKKLIDENKKQFKANLHCHTILSDGHWTAERVKEEYKKRGYSVVAITDHERLVSHNDLTDDEILFLTAYEVYVRNLPFDFQRGSQSHINLYSKTPENKMVYFTPNHIKYIPKDEMDKVEYHYYVENREFSVPFIKQMIKDAKKHGYICCHNHPTWSYENESHADAYEDCFAMEVYNHSAYVEGFDSYDEHYYIHQLNKGRRMGLIAADDNHDKYETDNPKNDSFGGKTYILADKLDYDTIINALENKEFYASTGPEIYSLTVDNGVMTVKCSNAERICFVNNTRLRGSTLGTKDSPLTEASFEINEKVDWVFVEITDFNGKKAFSRAFSIDELTEKE